MSVGSLRASLADRYRIERELGAGGMATVYLARDLKHDRPVALKVLRPELAASLGVERFLREIGTMGTLRHPHILPLYDSGEADGYLYYVMPVVEGESLRDRLQREKQLPIAEAVRLAREVAEALGHAHAHGIVHRDVKPANILLEGGHAVLADFGIARAVGAAGGDKLTATGLSIGTPAYMSPEQSFGEATIDGRSDLYALGCVLFEMLAGEPPYTGPTAQSIFAKRMAGPIPRLSALRETVSPALEQVVARLLATSPADRPSTADELVATLDGAQAAAATAPRSAPRAWRRPLRIAAILTVVIALGWQLRHRGAVGAADLSPDLLAVMPFSVHGSSDLAYLGDGMVDLMATKLDGAGTLRAANARSVVAMVKERSLDIADPGAALTVARHVGAGRYLTGDIVQAADKVRFTVHLYRTSRGDAAPDAAPLATATAEGRVDALFELIDSLAFTLVAGTLDDSTADRLQRLATTTTGNLDALKAYLHGEQLIRTGGRFREAEAAYEEAIRLDSSFALAWYRKSLTGDWTDAYDVRSSADRALELSDALTPRDRDLVVALQLRRHGHSSEAERLYREHLRRWPDEVEALVQLGEIMFHDGPRRGRSMMEAIPVYEHALRLEPDNFDARVHLARLYTLSGDLPGLEGDLRHVEADSLVTAAAAASSEGGERLFELQALAAFATPDTARQRDVIRRLRDKPVYYWFYAAHGASRFDRNPAGAQQILDALETTEPLLLMIRTNNFAVLGQVDSLRRFFDRIPGGRTVLWDMDEAFIWTSGAIAPDTARMAALLPRIRSADPAAMRRNSWVTSYEDLTDTFHRFERDYQVILLEIQLGRLAEARRDLAALRDLPPLENLGNLRDDAIRSLEAELLLAQGDRDGALRMLRTITYETPHASTYHAFSDGSRSRFLRAELELERGDTAVAIGFYRGFDESWSPWDSYHRASAYQRLGEIAEAQGRRDDATRYYGWLVDLWRDADPAFQPHRAAIAERRNALLAVRR